MDPSNPVTEAVYAEQRATMVENQVLRRGIKNPDVLRAMRSVPRHRFIPEANRSMAYADGPVGIGRGQTISQPYVVALMSEVLRIAPGHRILEVGTGSGYQSAVLAHMGARVYSVEIIEVLAAEAEQCLASTGYTQTNLRIADGYHGWPERAPFDGIIVTASPDHVPEPLVGQLAPGGRMIVPVGDRQAQDLLIVRRSADGFTSQQIIPVLFVPMTGTARGD